MHSGRDTRGLGCAAAAVVVMARGVAGGSLSFSRASGSLVVARAPFGSFLAFFAAFVAFAACADCAACAVCVASWPHGSFPRTTAAYSVNTHQQGLLRRVWVCCVG